MLKNENVLQLSQDKINIDYSSFFFSKITHRNQNWTRDIFTPDPRKYKRTNTLKSQCERISPFHQRASSAAIGYMLALKLPELWVWLPSGQEKRFPLEASITFQPRLKLINSISNKCTLATMSYETDVNVNFLILPIYRPTDWLTDCCW